MTVRRVEIEEIDNGFIVTGGPIPSNADPLAQRGKSYRMYGQNIDEVLEVIRNYTFREPEDR